MLAFADKADHSTYVLVTAFVGRLAPREPWDQNFESDAERMEALEFWSRNALVWDADVMSAPFESTWAEILG